MANALAELFKGIGDAIREVKGTTDKIKPINFRPEILSIIAPVKYVTFIGANGVELCKKACINGDDCYDPITVGLIPTPTKESTAAYVYTYSGWSLTDGGGADSTALANITEDRTVYAAFTSETRIYTVNFYEGDTLLQTKQVEYGDTPSYIGERPRPETDDYLFGGWVPEIAPVTGDINYSVVWVDNAVVIEEITDDWDTILASVNDGTYTIKYRIGNYKPLALSNGDVVNMQIIGFDAHQRYDNSKPIPITWYSMEVLSEKFAGQSTNVGNTFANNTGSYPITEMFSYFNTTVYSYIPENVRSAIVKAKIPSNTLQTIVALTGYDNEGNRTGTIAKTYKSRADVAVVFPLSKSEVFGIDSSIGENEHYFFNRFFNSSERRKRCGIANPNNNYSAALRSMQAKDFYYAWEGIYKFAYISTTGTNDMMDIDDQSNVAFAFCT